MSAEVERIFSSAKRLVTPDRNRLNDETMEVLELLKYLGKWCDHTVQAQVAIMIINTFNKHYKNRNCLIGQAASLETVHSIETELFQELRTMSGRLSDQMSRLP